MQDREATIRSRELGDALRAGMERAGMNGLQVAKAMDRSPSWVSRVLSGRRTCTEIDVVRFATVCGMRGAELERVMALAREQAETGWLQRHGSCVPAHVRTLVDHENYAREIHDFHMYLVPGLLQTQRYAREVIRTGANVPVPKIEDWVAARLARQRIWDRSIPPVAVYFLHEFVFRFPVGGDAVMSEQLHHLLRMSVRKYLTIRVVEASVGAHAALGGPFTLLDVAKFKPVIYLDSETTILFLEEPAEIEAYRNILTALDDIALDAEQSRRWIAHRATGYSEREDYADVT